MECSRNDGNSKPMPASHHLKHMGRESAGHSTLRTLYTTLVIHSLTWATTAPSTQHEVTTHYITSIPFSVWRLLNLCLKEEVNNCELRAIFQVGLFPQYISPNQPCFWESIPWLGLIRAFILAIVKTPSLQTTFYSSSFASIYTVGQ